MSSTAESALPYGTIIGNPYVSGMSPDNLPMLTQANFQNVSAVLELQSNDGALLITRLTTAQRNLLNPIQGMVIYNLTTGFYEVYSSGNAWEPLAEGGGGVLPYYITAGPLKKA
jgi:hypothetical protein